MANNFRKRLRLRVPITLSVGMMSLNVALMVCWIVLFARLQTWSLLTIGTVFFALILIGLTIYLIFSIKSVRLHHQQQNFVDSVTHELKSPIASLRLYLETLQMRDMDPAQRTEFYRTMESELQRLDHLINQLLEVGRLDAVGQDTDPEDVVIEPLLRRCAASACAHHKRTAEDVFRFDVQPAVVRARRIALEMIFGNLLDNAIKYAGVEPSVEVEVRVGDRGRVLTRIIDNGEGVPKHLRKRVFQLFYRGGAELERRQKGTGLGLYIVRTLVHFLGGKVGIRDRENGPGCVFEVELPGRAAA